MRRSMLVAATLAAAVGQIISLEANAHADAVRVLTSVVSLDGDTRSSWVTLTKAGKYSDPRYGEFEITRAMLLSMIDNFKAGTFGQQIFIDVAHMPANGAAATIKELSLDGGKLRALVEWTPYGIDAVKAKGYRYLSVEYVENFKDNEQGARHGPVLLGAGLTIRPVVKGLDAIALSEDGRRSAIHPDLRTLLLQEQSTMWETLIKLLMSNLVGMQLAEVVRTELVNAYTAATKHVTDDAVAKALCDQFTATGKKLAETIGSQSIKLDVSGITAGLTAEQVRTLMAEESTRLAEASKKLAEGKASRVKLLSDTIMAATSLPEETRRELAEAVADVISPDMTDDQIKRLADNQIASGSRMVAARQLTAMGFEHPVEGYVHVTVDDSNQIKALQDEVDKGVTARAGYERFQKTGGTLNAHNKTIADQVLAHFDAIHGARLLAEAGRFKKDRKLLAAGTGSVSDIAIPSIFERTVIREALYDLVGLSFVDSGVTPMSSIWQCPYSFRDTTAAGRTGVRVYEGGGIPRAGVKQTTEDFRPIPQKLAFLLSEEMRLLSQNGVLNYDAFADNVMNTGRIIGEDTEKLIFDEHLNAADEFSVVTVTGEVLTAAVNGTNRVFILANFPVVRPRVIRDLKGVQQGSTVNPITVTYNSVVRTEYDGTGTQAAGTYYSLDYNMGEVRIVSELGALITPPNTTPLLVTYAYTTNTFKWDSDLGALATDAKYDDLLYRFGLRKSVIEDQRYYMANYGLMSGTMRNQMEQARQFGANYMRSGTNLTADGNLGVIKALPCFKTIAPGINLGDQRIIVGQRNQTRLRVMKPWSMSEPQDARTAGGLFTAQKEAYGTQWIVIGTPTQLKGASTSIVIFSTAGRINRVS